MRKFIQFIRSEKETRLDVHCFSLKEREGEELYEIIKNLGITFCYVESDSLLAFLTGGDSYVKDTMKRLEKHYEFSWPEDPAIIGVSDSEINRDFLKKLKKRRGSKTKMVSKEKFRAYLKVQKSGITNMFDIAKVIEAADKIFEVELTRGDCIYIMENYKKLTEVFKNEQGQLAEGEKDLGKEPIKNTKITFLRMDKGD